MSATTALLGSPAPSHQSADAHAETPSVDCSALPPRRSVGGGADWPLSREEKYHRLRALYENDLAMAEEIFEERVAEVRSTRRHSAPSCRRDSQAQKKPNAPAPPSVRALWRSHRPTVDWPMSREEKKARVLRLYEDDLCAANRMLLAVEVASSGDSGSEGSQDESRSEYETSSCTSVSSEADWEDRRALLSTPPRTNHWDSSNTTGLCSVSFAAAPTPNTMTAPLLACEGPPSLMDLQPENHLSQVLTPPRQQTGCGDLLTGSPCPGEKASAQPANIDKVDNNNSSNNSSNKTNINDFDLDAFPIIAPPPAPRTALSMPAPEMSTMAAPKPTPRQYNPTKSEARSQVAAMQEIVSVATPLRNRRQPREPGRLSAEASAAGMGPSSSSSRGHSGGDGDFLVPPIDLQGPRLRGPKAAAAAAAAAQFAHSRSRGGHKGRDREGSWSSSGWSSGWSSGDPGSAPMSTARFIEEKLHSFSASISQVGELVKSGQKAFRRNTKCMKGMWRCQTPAPSTLSSSRPFQGRYSEEWLMSTPSHGSHAASEVTSWLTTDPPASQPHSLGSSAARGGLAGVATGAAFGALAGLPLACFSGGLTVPLGTSHELDHPGVAAGSTTGFWTGSALGFLWGLSDGINRIRDRDYDI